MGNLAHVGGDLARDASGHERGNMPLKGVHPSGSSHASLLLHSPRPSAFRASGWAFRVRATPPQRSHRRGACAFRFLRGGAVDLVFFLLLLEERDLMGVGALLPSLGFKDFHHVARLQSPASGHLQG
jgi:hypothetical protein